MTAEAGASTVEKMTLIRDSKGAIEGWVLPTGMTMDDVKSWTARFLMQVADRNAIQQKKLERFEGRSYREDWAKPTLQTLQAQISMLGYVSLI
jgi:hypothetical protein